MDIEYSSPPLLKLVLPKARFQIQSNLY